jgi:uncharacterized protein (DUF433 family)
VTIETRYEHVVMSEDGVPLIAGTTTKVIELVASHTIDGWNATELHDQFPYLTMGQIYSALAYYWDHKFQLDADLDRWFETAEIAEATMRPAAVVERLRAERRR